MNQKSNGHKQTTIYISIIEILSFMRGLLCLICCYLELHRINSIHYHLTEKDTPNLTSSLVLFNSTSAHSSCLLSEVSGVKNGRPKHYNIGHTTRNAGKLFPPVPPPTGGNLIRQWGRPALLLPDRFLGHALVLEFLMFHVLWSTVVC